MLLTEVAVTAHSMLQLSRLPRHFPLAEQPLSASKGGGACLSLLSKLYFKSCGENFTAGKWSSFIASIFRISFLNCNNIPMKHIRKDNLCGIKWSFYPLYQKYRWRRYFVHKAHFPILNSILQVKLHSSGIKRKCLYKITL